ncbi:hexose transporter [Auriscalpium vulgare]|uniref:Hexose transporter n=1 Tax=Auriscalpium vulgare TaxID=40419 RepID=A0ACB8RJI6_9AGAM|nr:hexose transporter [Auriscalpium vulgare]
MAHGQIDHNLSGEKFYLQLIDTSRPWYKNRRLVTLNLWIFLLLITSTANGYDGSMMNGLQILNQWEDAFNHPSGSKLGLLGAIQNIGSLGATPFAPYCADILGRKWTVIFGAGVMVAGTIIQTASQSVSMFIGARFLLGFGLGFAGNAAPMLVTEIAYPTQRAPVASIYNALWPGGAFIASWVTFGSFHINNSWAWRLPSACQAIPSVFQVLLMPWAPESPRWLVSKGREEEALDILAYYHASGNREDPLVQFEFEEIKTAIAEEKIQKQTGWLDLLRTPGMRRRMRIIIALALFSQWSGNGLVSYYLNQVFDTIGITNKTEQLLINAFLNLWSLIMAVLGGAFCDRLGRRTLFLTSTAGMLLFFTLQTIGSSQYALHGNKSAGNAVVAFIFLYSGAYAIAYSPLIVSYTLEVLPFAMRAKGMAAFSLAITASLVFNQYINPLALKAIAWKYYIVYCVWLAFELGYIYLFLVETKNRTLEETALIFDGDTSLVSLTRRAAINAGVEAGSGNGADESKSADEKGAEATVRSLTSEEDEGN